MRLDSVDNNTTDGHFACQNVNMLHSYRPTTPVLVLFTVLHACVRCCR